MIEKTKELSEMTLEELWRLFPIYLTEHNPDWAEWYSEEVEYLKTILTEGVEYHHIGSTAIQNIMAKPIIDIIIAVKDCESLKETAEILKEHNYIIMSENKNRISLNKGYTVNGFAEKVFHLHIRLDADTDEIYFRDYLNSHSRIAKEYEKLKLELWKKYKYNRNAYTDAKSEFVNKYTHLAKIDKK